MRRDAYETKFHKWNAFRRNGNEDFEEIELPIHTVLLLRKKYGLHSERQQGVDGSKIYFR